MTTNQKLALTVAFGLAIIFTLSCGEHGLENIFGSDSSSGTGEQALLGSSSSKTSSSSRLGSYSSSSQRQSSSSSRLGSSSPSEIGGGVEPPSEYTPAPPSIENSTGRVIVGPLLKTTWGNGGAVCTDVSQICSPFYTLPNGSHGWIKCGNVADAQIMNYYKYPKEAYDWDNMLNTYRNVNLTEQQKKAILALLHSLYLSNRYYDERIEFGYFEVLNWRQYYEATWAEMVREILDLGLLVRMRGCPTIGECHAFIIDGYDDKGKFHINWGWGGSRDGYYSLDSLNPGGRSQEDGFNKNVNLRIIIPPEKVSLLGEPALTTFSTEKTSGRYGAFKVKIALKFDIAEKYYVALFDSNGKRVQVIGRDYYGEGGGSYTILSEIHDYEDYGGSNVPPGKYSLRILYSLDCDYFEDCDGLKEITKSVGNVPTSIDFTVN
ncbi:MAG: C10 family peptidase [Fibromonadaceae bacterium]|jgi:hypothetical protein|nr:C10 family peptidase [Fibromonadaceae bacterium]